MWEYSTLIKRSIPARRLACKLATNGDHAFHCIGKYYPLAKEGTWDTNLDAPTNLSNMVSVEYTFDHRRNEIIFSNVEVHIIQCIMCLFIYEKRYSCLNGVFTSTSYPTFNPPVVKKQIVSCIMTKEEAAKIEVGDYVTTDENKPGKVKALEFEKGDNVIGMVREIRKTNDTHTTIDVLLY